jgi:hypothetical protein
MTATKRKVVQKIDTSKPALKIEEGEVVKVPLPETVVEEYTVEEEVDSGKPKYRIETGNGEAVYEYSGDCWDCNLEHAVTAVFACKTHPIRADGELGNQLAAFWADGSFSTPLCQRHYQIRLGNLPQQSSPVLKVIEKTM